MKQFIFLTLFILAASLSQAMETEEQVYVQCSDNFEAFKEQFKQVALEKNYPKHIVDHVFQAADYSSGAVSMSQKKGVFKQNFSEFYKERGSSYVRNKVLLPKLQQYKSIFDLAEDHYGVPREVLVTFWQLETNFGTFQGDYNTLDSLMTLASRCERPGLFQPQVLAMLNLVEMGFADTQTTGAWAGEIGQFQFLPQNILNFGVDGDGDGRVDLKNSAADAILSAANMLMFEGWKTDQPWVEEVQVQSNNAWEHSGLDKKLTRAQWNQLGVKDSSGEALVSQPELKASLIAPEGRIGSVFLVYENFNVFLEWNQSLIYTLSAANVANGLVPGVRPLQARSAGNGLSTEQMMRLQALLQSNGFDVGDIDGILGAGTRSAVREVQKALGLPQDGWPTVQLYRDLGL